MYKCLTYIHEVHFGMMENARSLIKIRTVIVYLVGATTAQVDQVLPHPVFSLINNPGLFAHKQRPQTQHQWFRLSEHLVELCRL